MWKINRSKPVSLDYTNSRFGYRGNSVTGTAYWVRLDDVRSEAGLTAKLRHLNGKTWFESSEFLEARAKALLAGL
jgi:hypothetical protein